MDIFIVLKENSVPTLNLPTDSEVSKLSINCKNRIDAQTTKRICDVLRKSFHQVFLQHLCIYYHEQHHPYQCAIKIQFYIETCLILLIMKSYIMIFSINAIF